jgi:hypothetical protein
MIAQPLFFSADGRIEDGGIGRLWGHEAWPARRENRTCKQRTLFADSNRVRIIRSTDAAACGKTEQDE